jgi:hypothetical protein
MDLNFDLESFNRALAAKGLPPVTAEEFYGTDEEKKSKPMTAKQREKRKSRRKMQKKSKRINRNRK